MSCTRTPDPHQVGLRGDWPLPPYHTGVYPVRREGSLLCQASPGRGPKRPGAVAAVWAPAPGRVEGPHCLQTGYSEQVCVLLVPI